jgi:hypothetical protein
MNERIGHSAQQGFVAFCAEISAQESRQAAHQATPFF